MGRSASGKARRFDPTPGTTAATPGTSPAHLPVCARPWACYAGNTPSLCPGSEIAAMNVVTSTDGLAVLCRQLANSTYVAVDTEFMREQTFWPKLCLIQLAGPDDEAIVDPLADRHRSRAVLGADGQRRRGQGVPRGAPGPRDRPRRRPARMPAPVFDTQVAAMVCGFGDSVSYVNLVKQLDRPGPRQVIALHRLEPPAAVARSSSLYALGDVTHLREVYTQPQARAREPGRAALARRGNGDPDRPRDLRDRSRRTPGGG